MSGQGKEIPGPPARVRLANDLKEHMETILANISSNEMVITSADNRLHWMGELDAAIANLQRLSGLVAAALVRERNALNSALFLPPEVLVEIFRFGGIKCAKAASHVCHKWRIAAINEPSLWTYIDMSDPLYSEKGLHLQLTRAGQLSLDLNFHVMDEGTSFYNIKVPDNIESLLLNAKSISNICPQTFQTRVDLVELESLHVTVNHCPLDPCLGSTPKLAHLSVDSVGRWLPTGDFTTNLRTLHIRGGYTSAATIVDVVSKLPHLRELLISSFTNGRELDPFLSGLEPVLLRSLKLLSVSKLQLGFLQELLAWVSLPSAAYLRIVDWPLHLSIHTTNTMIKCDAKAAYIDGENQNLYYDHETSTSQITANKDPAGIFKLPSVIPKSPIHTLTWLTDHPSSNFVWSGFENLRNISFSFSPKIVGGEVVPLYSVLTDDLLVGCPRLEFLGIVLKKGGGRSAMRIGFRDCAEDAIPSFLESWMELYSKPFQRIRIQDEIKPKRWEICAPIFESLIERFELGHVSLDMTINPVPNPRRFQPDLDPNSTSLPADRTALSRWGRI